MRIALKEWAVVVEALASGRQIVLLRKGGLAESRDGFELKHREFLFFPTWEHQQRGWIEPFKREFFEQLEPGEQDRITLQYGARVSDFVRIRPDAAALARLSDAFVWDEPYLRMRCEYKPELPLSLVLVLVRAYSLPRPCPIPIVRRYNGCRSWVELDDEIDVAGAIELIEDAHYSELRRDLLNRVQEVRLPYL